MMKTEIKRNVPIPIKIASLVWILYGLVIGLGSILLAVLGGSKGGRMVDLGLALALFGIGLFFLYTGFRTIRGKAKGTIGNGIGALIFGGALIANSLDSSANVLIGLGLFISGVMCVAYHKQYSNTLEP